jgi:hypothetical protein
MTGILLSEATAGKLRGLLQEGDDAPVFRRRGTGGGGSRWVMVRADSATAGGTSGAGLQCYSGTIVGIGADDTNVTLGAQVWFTLLWPNTLPMTGSAPRPPQVNRVYECLLLGDVDVAGVVRPRAIGTPANIDADIATYGVVSLTGQRLGDGAKLFNRAVVVNTSCNDASGGGSFTGLIGLFVVLDSHSTFEPSSGIVENPVFRLLTDPNDTAPRTRTAVFFDTSDIATKDKSLLTVRGKLTAERVISAPCVATYDGSTNPTGVNGWVASAYGFRVGDSAGNPGVTETDANAGFVFRGGIITGFQGATGDVLYHDGTRWRRLPFVSNSKILGGAAGVPAWVDPPPTGITSIGSSPTTLTGFIRGNGTTTSGGELSGDVTSSGGFATTIATGAVSGDKIADDGVEPGKLADNAVTTAKIADSQVTEAKLLLADNTTGNATTARHGLLRKLSNVATEYLDGTGNWSVPAVGAPIASMIPGGRLTLSSTIPVTESDITAATTLYYLPYLHTKVKVYTGSAWKVMDIGGSGISIAITGTNLNVYDVFVYDNAGTPTLELGGAWTNDSTRSTAIAQVDGVPVKSGATTRTYLGSIWLNATNNQCDDSATRRGVFNMYNRVGRHMAIGDNTSHSYTTAAWRKWRNGATTDLYCLLADPWASDVPHFAATGECTGGAGYIGVGWFRTATTTYPAFDSWQMGGGRTMGVRYNLPAFGAIRPFVAEYGVASATFAVAQLWGNVRQ